MKIIEVDSKTHGKHQILLDDEDYEIYSKFKWTIRKDKNTFYAQRCARICGIKKTCILHREICALTKGDGLVVDHVNRNGLDNRRENLRICTVTENNRNTTSRANSTSKYKGVWWEKARRKWRAVIKFDNKSIHLGSFINEIDAAKAYNEAALKYHGKFANINIIEE